jgi:hypothetical protein
VWGGNDSTFAMKLWRTSKFKFLMTNDCLVATTPAVPLVHATPPWQAGMGAGLH